MPSDFEVYVHTINLRAAHPARTGSLTVTGSAAPNTVSGIPQVTVDLLFDPMNAGTVASQTVNVAGGIWSATFLLPNTLPPTGALGGKIRARLMLNGETAMAIRSFTFA